MRYFLYISLLILNSCASTQQQSCPSYNEEPVSVCRAEVACGKGSSRMGWASVFGALGGGSTGGRNRAVDNYNECVDRNLSAQKANAGVPDNHIKCKIRKTSDTEVEGTCD